MPNVDIISLKLPQAHKESLVEAVTGAFTEVLGCNPDAVVIRFHDLEAGSYAAGGKLWGEFARSAPPAIFQMNIEWYAGKTEEQQNKVAAALTEAVSKHAGIRSTAVEIRFGELNNRNYFENGRRINVPAKPGTP